MDNYVNIAAETVTVCLVRRCSSDTFHTNSGSSQTRRPSGSESDRPTGFTWQPHNAGDLVQIDPRNHFLLGRTLLCSGQLRLCDASLALYRLSSLITCSPASCSRFLSALRLFRFTRSASYCSTSAIPASPFLRYLNTESVKG